MFGALLTHMLLDYASQSKFQQRRGTCFLKSFKICVAKHLRHQRTIFTKSYHKTEYSTLSFTGTNSMVFSPDFSIIGTTPSANLM
jgi:hypothetical protein